LRGINTTTYFTGNSRANSEYKSNINGGVLGPAGPSAFCSNGPIRTLYSRPGHFYWPPIRIKQCDGLLCRYPGKCVASSRCVLLWWASVFRRTNCRCYLVGICYLWLLENTSCQCRECSRDLDCTSPKKFNRSSWTCHVLMLDMMECPAGLATDGTAEHADAHWSDQLDYPEVLHKTKSNLTATKH